MKRSEAHLYPEIDSCIVCNSSGSICSSIGRRVLWLGLILDLYRLAYLLLLLASGCGSCFGVLPLLGLELGDLMLKVPKRAHDASIDEVGIPINVFYIAREGLLTRQIKTNAVQEIDLD
jgi:hypothetical protein